MLDIAASGSKHTTCSARLIFDSNNLAWIEDIVATFSQKQRDKQLDDITTGIKLTGVYVLIETTNQILEYVPHLDTIERLDRQIQLGKRLHNGVKATVLVHLLDMVVHIQLAEDILDICRKTVQILPEILRNMVGIVAKLFQIELARIIELIPGNTLHCLRRIRRVLLILRDDLILRIC